MSAYLCIAILNQLNGAKPAHVYVERRLLGEMFTCICFDYFAAGSVREAAQTGREGT